jgi:hypothetical protein
LLELKVGKTYCFVYSANRVYYEIVAMLLKICSREETQLLRVLILSDSDEPEVRYTSGEIADLYSNSFKIKEVG